MDEYMNNENNTQESQSDNTQNSGQYNNGGNYNSNNNNGTYQGNDWQNGGFNNSYGGAGQENGGYGNSYGGGYGNGSYGGYSDSGRQSGRRLKRSATNRMVCGVCAGIAEYFNWDPTIIRIIWVAASIFLGAGFLGVIAYFIVAVIMPER